MWELTQLCKGGCKLVPGSCGRSQQGPCGGNEDLITIINSVMVSVEGRLGSPALQQQQAVWVRPGYREGHIKLYKDFKC